MGLAVPLEAVFNDDDLMDAAFILTNKSCARFQTPLRSSANDAARASQFCRQTLQALPSGRTQAAKSLFLNCVCQCPEEQLLTKALGWIAAQKGAPALLEGDMIEMLKRPEGATVEQIAAVTGWQHHTIRGAISGALKKKLGLTIETTRSREIGPNKTGAKGSATVYRITGASPRGASGLRRLSPTSPLRAEVGGPRAARMSDL